MNDMPTRIAVLGIKAIPAYAGADRVVEQLLQNAPPTQHHTIYLMRRPGPRLSGTPQRRYVYVPALKGKHLGAASYFFFCCIHYLLRGSYDVAHVHNSDFGLFCPLLRLKRKVHVVGTFHGDPASRAKWNGLAKALLRASERVFVRACHQVTSVSKEKAVAGRKVKYIPNGVYKIPADPARGAELRTRLGIHEGDYVMFACGRLDRTKGLHHLLDAYGTMATSEQLLAVGDFSHDSKYARQIDESAGKDERVVLHRSLVDAATLADMMRQSSVFVFPSEVEGMSMVLLEAVMWARQVVCSDIAANKEIVGADYPLLFDSADPAALKVRLQEALNKEADEHGAMPVQVARERVVARFSWEEIALAYEHAYEACV
jgi:glycosyltransferase involved in cell wall biosynthesis